jgi:hypothetical protein
MQTAGQPEMEEQIEASPRRTDRGTADEGGKRGRITDARRTTWVGR